MHHSISPVVTNKSLSNLTSASLACSPRQNTVTPACTAHGMLGNVRITLVPSGKCLKN